MTIMASLSNSDGEFIFSLGNGTVLASHQRRSGASFKQAPLLQAKPRQELSGGELDRRVLQGISHESDADTKIEALYDLKKTNKPVVLVIAGQAKGLWTMGSVSDKSAETNPNGKAKEVEFSVELEEFANE